MLDRIKRTGLNVTVLIISIAVFIIAFLLILGLVNSEKPQTMDVLSATRDLNTGEIVGTSDLAVKTVYLDSDSSLFIPADQLASVEYGIVAVPIYAGQPIFRTSLVAPAAEGARISAILAKYPGFGLFPLPLDKSNIIAPSANSFMPGDLVELTIVISARPQSIDTPTPEASYYYNPANPNLVIPSPTPLPTLSSGEAAKQAADQRTYPPLAKSLLPAGVRVVAVQGLPPTQIDNNAGAPGPGTGSAITSSPASPSDYANYSQPKILILMVPLNLIETLSLSLQEGDLLVVSLLAKGSNQPTPGFTYWDLEQLIRIDRQQVLGAGQ
jgi:hypothetical protein